MLEDKVLKTINKYNMITEEDKNVLLAVSGGFDSTCMLYILNSLKEKLHINISVVHVNHGLRENALLDEEYVKNICLKFGNELIIKKVDINEIAKNTKQSLETAGRNARYKIFEEVAEEKKCTKILTAHNLNDNAETILMNIFRGTGLNGLKGIKKMRDEKYIRPLIEISRDEINEYLAKNNIIARLDESNNENDYRRNKIRNELIPYIKENFNENILNALNKMADIVVYEDEYITKVVDKSFNDCCIELKKDYVVINSKILTKCELNIQKRIVLKCIEYVQGTTIDIETIHINDIIKMINKNIGNKFLMPNKNLKITINKGQLVFEKI